MRKTLYSTVALKKGLVGAMAKKRIAAWLVISMAAAAFMLAFR